MRIAVLTLRSGVLRSPLKSYSSSMGRFRPSRPGRQRFFTRSTCEQRGEHQHVHGWEIVNCRAGREFEQLHAEELASSATAHRLQRKQETTALGPE